MTQNTSSAVMAGRREAKDSLDDFPTPPFATRALCEHVINIRGSNVWEPACGRGHMLRALQGYALKAEGSDIADYGGNVIHDFLGDQGCVFEKDVDFVVSNPPFRRALEFVERGLEVAQVGVAVLVRSVFAEGQKRYCRLFSKRPPSIIAQFVERVAIVKGRVDKDATTATSYCWMTWYREPAWPVTKTIWIPPSRKLLEREGDYV